MVCSLLSSASLKAFNPASCGMLGYKLTTFAVPIFDVLFTKSSESLMYYCNATILAVYVFAPEFPKVLDNPANVNDALNIFSNIYISKSRKIPSIGLHIQHELKNLIVF